MRKVIVPLVFALLAAGLVGCQTPSGESASEKEFEAQYREYSKQFHEKMVGKAETMTPAQITAEASRTWSDVFGNQKALLDARITEILADLEDADPIDEEVYVEIASGERIDPTEDQPKGIVVKQFLWNPVGAAQMALNNWLARLLQAKSFRLRQLLTANARLFWAATDRSLEHPKLQMRQGGLIYTVDLARVDDYYRVEKVRWLRPKSMGPIGVTSEDTPATDTPATDTPATDTSATETPATETPATETPATETPATETPAKETETKPAG